MKTITQILIIGYFLLIGCSNSGSEENKTGTKKAPATPPAEEKEETSAAPKGDGIVGDWKLMLETYDDNENRQLDAEERKKAFSNQFFYRFNSDGSCLINFTRSSKGAFKGHYVIKEPGKKLTTYLDETEQKGLEAQYSIISVSRDELVLLEAMGDLTFWIFKRG